MPAPNITFTTFIHNSYKCGDIVFSEKRLLRFLFNFSDITDRPAGSRSNTRHPLPIGEHKGMYGHRRYFSGKTRRQREERRNGSRLTDLKKCRTGKRDRNIHRGSLSRKFLVSVPNRRIPYNKAFSASHLYFLSSKL